MTAFEPRACSPAGVAQHTLVQCRPFLDSVVRHAARVTTHAHAQINLRHALRVATPHARTSQSQITAILCTQPGRNTVTIVFHYLVNGCLQTIWLTALPS